MKPTSPAGGLQLNIKVKLEFENAGLFGGKSENQKKTLEQG